MASLDLTDFHPIASRRPAAQLQPAGKRLAARKAAAQPVVDGNGSAGAANGTLVDKHGESIERIRRNADQFTATAATIFDIETGPLSLDHIRAYSPAFDESEIKCGNIKDPEKIAAKLAEARAAHERKYIDRAALSPLTGKVLCIGYYQQEQRDEAFAIDAGAEAVVLAEFWLRWKKIKAAKGRLVGFNCHEFDLPFIARRSWLVNVPVPSEAMDANRRWWNETFVDLAAAWRCGVRQDYMSLDVLAKALGAGRKTGSGKDFAELWGRDRPAAEEYLLNDLRLTHGCAFRLGVV